MANQIATAGERAIVSLDRVSGAFSDRGEAISVQIADLGDRTSQSLDQASATLGGRGQDVADAIAGAAERAIQAVERQIAGLADLLTNRTDQLIAAVDGAAGEPVRALAPSSARSGPRSPVRAPPCAARPTTPRSVRAR